MDPYGVYGEYNPPLSVVLPELNLRPEVDAFIRDQQDRILTKLVNYARYHPDLTLEEAQELAVLFQPQGDVGAPTPSYKEKTFVSSLDNLNRMGPTDVQRFSDWAQKVLVKARVPGSGKSAGIEYLPNEITYAYDIGGRGEDETYALTDDVDLYDLSQMFNSLIDWIVATIEPYWDMSLDDALTASYEWHNACNVGGPDAYQDGEEGIVYRYPDGWTIRQILTKNDIEAEGNKMGHCVGSYWSDVADDKIRVFSLRDRKNKPHATFHGNRSKDDITILWADRGPGIEMDLMDIKGKQNEEPSKKHKDRLREYFMDSGAFTASRRSQAFIRSDVDETAERIKDDFLAYEKGIHYREHLSTFEPEYGLKIDLLAGQYEAFNKVWDAVNNDWQLSQKMAGDEPQPHEKDFASEEDWLEALSKWDEVVNEGLNVSWQEYLNHVFLPLVRTEATNAAYY
jgi:hypothetical protein